MRDRVEGLRAESRAAFRDGYTLIAISCMFLLAVGWWGAGERWWEAWTAAAASYVLSWCAGGELHRGRLLGEQADGLAERLRAGIDCCCALSLIPNGAHFTADEHRIHTPDRCQDLRAWAAAGGAL